MVVARRLLRVEWRLFVSVVVDGGFVAVVNVVDVGVGGGGVVVLCVVGWLFNRNSAFVIASGHLFLGRCDCFNMALP